MAKRLKFDPTDFPFGANAPARKTAAKKAGGKAKRKPSGVRVWKGRTFGS